MATAAPHESTAVKDTAMEDVFKELASVGDDLERALAQEKAMARTLLDTIHRLDVEGENLRRQAKA